ncbi:MAG: hypothetical protein U5K28_05935 [Halobacteriales archaeon]|nr:hypothetical protein [Halobacteriales archaeon]
MSTTLHIRVGEGEQLHKQARERLERAEQGKPVEPMEPVLNFESLAEFERLMSESNLRLLRAIARHEPESIAATAELVDRGYKEVHTNLSELEALNVIEFEEHGRAKRPVLRYDELDIDVSLVDTADKTPEAA